MIFLSEKENLIVLHPKSGEILVRFQNGKCFIDEDKKEDIALMKKLGYKFEEEFKVIKQGDEIREKLSSKKNKNKEVI
jgi:hypothetical protein